MPDNLVVTERKMIMSELVEAEKNGTLLEVFGTGTAAIVSAVERCVLPFTTCLVTERLYRIGYEERDIIVPTGPDGMGQIAKAVLNRIVGIQTGVIPHEWSVVAN